MRFLIIFMLILLPVTASALDCAPFQSWTCAQQGYYDYLNGVPGEILCGVDYTGWTLHVVEVTVTQPGFYVFGGVSASSSWNIVDTAIMLMDDCNAGTCISSLQTDGVTELYACLDVGTHTFVVASNTTVATAFMNIGFGCHTCVEAEAVGFECAHCGTVSNESSTWGSVKTRFQ